MCLPNPHFAKPSLEDTSECSANVIDFFTITPFPLDLTVKLLFNLSHLTVVNVVFIRVQRPISGLHILFHANGLELLPFTLIQGGTDVFETFLLPLLSDFKPQRSQVKRIVSHRLGRNKGHGGNWNSALGVRWNASDCLLSCCENGDPFAILTVFVCKNCNF